MTGAGTQTGVTMRVNTRLTAIRFARRCAWMACCIVGMLALSACDTSEYPDDWPGHAWGLFSRKGGCPDLVGEYDGVNEEFVGLFYGGQALVKSENYAEHRAIVTQADDGSWLEIAIRINERGMEQLEAGTVGGNVWGGYRHIKRRRGNDYQCFSGWVESDDWKMGRDRSGALIAHWSMEIEGSIGWGDSQRISTGTGVRNFWRRWPARDTTRNAALAKQGHFLLRRAEWINGGRSTPVYISAFFAEPLCARFVHRYGRRPEQVRMFAIGTVADKPGPLDCPVGWARVASGETQLQEMNLADEDGEQYRFEWFRHGENPPLAHVIEINDVGALPDGGEAGKRLRIGQESVRVN